MKHDVRHGYTVIVATRDWALLDQNGKGWIVAHYPNYDPEGNILDWGYGHYWGEGIGNFFMAVNYLENEIELEGKEE